jgi:hypothetical protein
LNLATELAGWGAIPRARLNLATELAGWGAGSSVTKPEREGVHVADPVVSGTDGPLVLAVAEIQLPPGVESFEALLRSASPRFRVRYMLDPLPMVALRGETLRADGSRARLRVVARLTWLGVVLVAAPCGFWLFLVILHALYGVLRPSAGRLLSQALCLVPLCPWLWWCLRRQGRRMLEGIEETAARSA